MITIGPYTIMKMKNGKVWIRHEDGEGGQFSEAELVEHIGKFYAEKF